MFALFSEEGISFLFRWTHFLAGITWIGLLYYFNLVQVPFFGETEAPVRNGAISKLVPRALWWFRWGAMFTFLSGLGMMTYKVMEGGMAMFSTSWGLNISLASTLGTLMFLNVWLIIWPKQKIVIASTQGVLAGGAADPAAADAGARAFVASRTNTLFSIPMLFFMGAASHLTLTGDTKAGMGLALGIPTLIVLAIEANVLFGKKGVGFSKLLDKHVNVIYAGIGLAVLFYGLMDGLTT